MLGVGAPGAGVIWWAWEGGRDRSAGGGGGVRHSERPSAAAVYAAGVPVRRTGAAECVSAELRGVWAELERVVDPAVDPLLMTAVVPGAWWQAGAVRALDVPLVAAF